MQRRTVRRIVVVVLAASTASTASLASAQWKWTDQDGVVTYSDRPPPPSIPATRIQVQPGASGGATASPPGGDPDARTTADREFEFRQRQAAREAALRDAASREQAAQAQARACESARERLRTLESGRRLAEIDLSGERRVLTEEAREERIRTLRDDLRERCPVRER